MSDFNLAYRYAATGSVVSNPYVRGTARWHYWNGGTKAGFAERERKLAAMRGI